MDAIENRTLHKVRIMPLPGKAPVLVLPPLGARTVASRDLYDLADLEGRGAVRVLAGAPAEEVQREELISRLATGAIMTIVAAFVISAVVSGWTASRWMALLSGVAVGCVGLVTGVVHVKDKVPTGDLWSRAIAQVLTLLAVLFITVGTPLVILYYLAGGRQLLAGEVPAFISDALDPTGGTLTLVAHAMQAVFVIAASALPALLFFLFDRERLTTLRVGFYRDMMRLDPEVRNVDDVEDRYETLIEENLGPPNIADTSFRLVRGTRLPVVIATLFVTLGWVFTLVIPTLQVAVTDPTQAYRLLIPTTHAITYAFLGAYFYSLLMLRRRYSSGDLRPKAYTHMAVRILLAVLAAVVLDAVSPLDGVPLLVLAFLLGATPELLFTFLKETLSARGGGRFAKLLPSIEEKDPLTHLKGITLYERTRLAEEGVPNIHALANCRLPRLLLATRLPAARLVDWVDQALLYERLGTVDGQAPLVRLHHLRSRSVHKASDLIEQAEANRNRGPEAYAAWLRSLDPDDDTASPPLFESVLDALRGEEWLPYVVKWRREWQGHAAA